MEQLLRDRTEPYLHVSLEKALLQALADFVDFVLSHRQRYPVGVLRPII